MSSGKMMGLLKNLSTEEPRLNGLRIAAVSTIFKDGSDPRVLLIKRAERSGDPWSGQIAFPGGKMQPGDVTAMDTAIRETKEEVGIDLAKDAKFVGYSEPTATHTREMQVVPCTFLLTNDVEVVSNGEVDSHRWVSIETLLSKESRTTYRLEYGDRTVELPAMKVGDYVVWGLTHRIMSSMFGTN